jgi:hypothetical protein
MNKSPLAMIKSQTSLKTQSQKHKEHEMTEDRNYLRMLSDGELVRTALDRNHELAVVLAERLSELLDVDDQLEAAKAEIEEITASREYWRAEAIEAQFQLAESVDE